MSVLINAVTDGSIAQKYNIKPADTLVSINEHPIVDVLDYRFYMTEKALRLSLLDGKGVPYFVEVKKPLYDDLGLEFETYLIDSQRTCKNKCVFCFIDQLPNGLRETLYVKDDDSRLSFLMGNYITLTNLVQADIDRLIEMHISPINISVHTTDRALRVQMMGNKHSGDVLDYLYQLLNAGIKINAQLVLCPNINDEKALEQSLNDLCAFAPTLQSLAVVPVGLTKFRDNLPALSLFDKESARRVIDAVNKFGSEMLTKHGQRICFASDEFYISAQLEIPEYDFYEDFPQLENGVGMLALLIDEFTSALQDINAKTLPRKVTIATGVAAAPFIHKLADLAMDKFPQLEVSIVAIQNSFFGESITVTGLLTGVDIKNQLQKVDIGQKLLLARNMIRHEGDLLLDDYNVKDLARDLNCEIQLVENDGTALLTAMIG